jgi:alkyl hydroperoxide reductase subunit F
MFELIIVGSGPAGMAAAVYAARKQLNILLVSIDIGGQVNLTNGVENYLGFQFIEGFDLISKFQQQVNQFPIDQRIKQKVTQIQKVGEGFEVSCESGDKYQGKVVILASGKRPRKLNVEGEFELMGKGITYCSICDGPDFTGRRVAVVGGGNSAIESTLDMVKVAEHVDLISVTPLTGDPVLIDKLSEANNLTIYAEQRTEKILGQDTVEGIIIKDLKTGAYKTLAVSGVFVEIGLVPNSDMVNDLIKLNQLGEVPVNCSCETELPGLFAAGDVTTVPEKQIVIAAGEGAKAALQAHRYLRRLPKEVLR